MNRNRRCQADPIRPYGDQHGKRMREHLERVGDPKSAEEKLGKNEKQAKEEDFEGLCDVKVPSAEVLNYENEDDDLFAGEGEVIEITEDEAGA